MIADDKVQQRQRLKNKRLISLELGNALIPYGVRPKVSACADAAAHAWP